MCNVYRSPQALPFPMIKVGDYRNLALCKKQHLTDEEDIAKAIVLITQVLEEVRNSGDSTVDFLCNGSPKPKEDDLPLDHNCAGYNKLIPEEERCGCACDGLLSIDGTTGGDDHSFCKASHLMRYMGKYYCGQGKCPAPSRPQRKKSKKSEKEVEEIITKMKK